MARHVAGCRKKRAAPATRKPNNVNHAAMPPMRRRRRPGAPPAVLSPSPPTRSRVSRSTCVGIGRGERRAPRGADRRRRRRRTCTATRPIHARRAMPRGRRSSGRGQRAPVAQGFGQTDRASHPAPAHTRRAPPATHPGRSRAGSFRSAPWSGTWRSAADARSRPAASCTRHSQRGAFRRWPRRGSPSARSPSSRSPPLEPPAIAQAAGLHGRGRT